MKVGILCKPLDKPFSGSGSHLKGLLSSIAKIPSSINITLLSYTQLDEYYTSNFETIILSGNYFRDIIFLNRQKFDLIHYHPLTIYSPIFVNTKLVSTIHGASGVALKSELGFFRYFHDKFIRRLLSKKMDHLFTVSQASLDWLTCNYNIKNKDITLVHNGISDDLKKFISESKGINSFDSRKFVLHVSNFSSRKNPLVVLEVFRQLSYIKPDMNFIIAGKGWDCNNNFEFISKNGLSNRVKILGFVTDRELADLYSSAKVYFSPSLYEGFGMPNIEAMYCGTPVVISNAFAAGSVSGSAAHVSFEPNNINYFVNAIYKLYIDKFYWDKYSKKSLLHSTNFSWTHSAVKTLNIYKNICE